MDKKIVVKAFLILLVVMMAVLDFTKVMPIPNEVLSAVLGDRWYYWLCTNFIRLAGMREEIMIELIGHGCNLLPVTVKKTYGWV